jgi:hypothetical protein
MTGIRSITTFAICAARFLDEILPVDDPKTATAGENNYSGIDRTRRVWPASSTARRCHDGDRSIALGNRLRADHLECPVDVQNQRERVDQTIAPQKSEQIRMALYNVLEASEAENIIVPNLTISEGRYRISEYYEPPPSRDRHSTKGGWTRQRCDVAPHISQPLRPLRGQRARCLTALERLQLTNDQRHDVAGIDRGTFPSTRHGQIKALRFNDHDWEPRLWCQSKIVEVEPAAIVCDSPCLLADGMRLVGVPPEC